MPTIGTDCDFTLTHASVNGGAAVGFVFRRKGRGYFQIFRSAYLTSDGSYADRYKITARVLLSDESTNPNGSIHSTTRATAYASLLSFLSQRTAITLTCAIGTFTGLRATLDVSNELHYEKHSDLFLTLNNGGYDETIPVDLVRFNGSIWDGSYGWGYAYWR